MKKDELEKQIQEGILIPFIGMGVFKNVFNNDGVQLPYDSDSMILALNNGRAMSSRLMYEYSRAAMSLEQKKGRVYLNAMIEHCFKSHAYEMPSVYHWLKTLMPHYVIDLNLDDSLLKVYEQVDHFLVTGVSRIMAGYDRFIVYRYCAQEKRYSRIDKALLNSMLPTLFKPLGCVTPEKNFILSDADFVDWLTEAMGGYAVPSFLKHYRENKGYLFMGIDFDRDTLRMVANEITLGCSGGYLLNDREAMSKKEERFLMLHHVEKLNISLDGFLKSAF